MKKLLFVSVLFLFGVSFAFGQFSFTSLDFPQGTLTTARGINNSGQIVGAYRVNPPRHAMFIDHAQYLPLGSGTLLDILYSEAFKINSRGDIVGQFIGDDGFTHGFLWRKGVITILDFPGASDTTPFGINDSGTVIGSWDILDADGNVLAYHGFVWKDGGFSEFNYPGSADTTITGINARGEMVGLWDSDITSPIGHGFICKGDACSSFDVPVAGVIVTQPNDINARGDIVGAYIDADNVTHGFRIHANNFLKIDFPDAVRTLVWGINAAGQMVGTYYDYSGAPARGFLAEPENIGKP